MEYQCQKCGFKFNAVHRPPSCPYCGEIGMARPVPTASDILGEVTETKEEKPEKKE